ncbi:hypothetical protein VNO78_36249 [Psophocarpus tetragonolobus]|uniref:Senescence-associated protein n=1 Tax=Psophocarpus tetragonolobus TaxID=3891 RepID=A0AAN9RDC1_PSOTE
MPARARVRARAMPARARVRARAHACQGAGRREGRIKATRAESQWIVAARPLCHLQYPVAYLSRLQRILPAARWELRFKASHRANPPCEGRQRHVPLGGRGPLLLVGKRTTGARVASSPDSDLEAFSHNPTHAHVPYWWVNNPTLGEFCFTMIGRADIEGSKSNVAMNAWLPQASYPCGNFSDTSSFKFRRTKGSIGHAFTVRIRTGNQNQTSFYPFVPHEISVLVELILGHLRYLLTDVPPQPNSPPDNVFRPDQPTEAGLGSRKRGSAPLPIHGIIGFPLSVPVLSRLFDARGRDPEGPVPNPSPDRHATTRSRRGSSSSSPPTADGFGTGTPVPSPQSQSFSRGYGSILPTSLAYIVPSTRGCSPWRPDAVMSTTGRGRHSVLQIFKGRRGRTGHHATCGALPAAGPYLRLSRFQGGQAICTDGRSARARALGFAATAAPSYSSGPGPCPDGRTPWSVFQDGPNGEPTGRRQEHARAEARPRAHAAIHNRHDDVSASISTARAWATVAIRIGPCPESIGGPALAVPHPTGAHRRPPSAWHIADPHPLPSRQFQALFDSLFKVLFIFPSRQACPQPNGFGRNLQTRWFTGFCNSHQVSHFATFFIDARAEISVAESHFASCVVTTPAGHRLRVPKNRPLQFQFPWHTKRRGSPTETLLRLLLPLNDKVQWTSHNVAGSEPPTSPQSEHFTGPFNR